MKDMLSLQQVVVSFQLSVTAFLVIYALDFGSIQYFATWPLYGHRKLIYHIIDQIDHIIYICLTDVPSLIEFLKKLIDHDA